MGFLFQLVNKVVDVKALKGLSSLVKKVLILPSSSFSAFYFLFFDMEKSVGTTLPLESVFLLFKNNRLRSIQPPPPKPNRPMYVYWKILGLSKF